MRSVSNMLRQSLQLAIALACLFAFVNAVRAQVPWEYSPYKIDAFVALENPADLDIAAQQRLAQRVVDLSQAHLGAPWTLEVHFADGALLGELLLPEMDVPIDRLIALTPNDAQSDKAFYIVVGKQRTQWRVQLRELDYRTFHLSPPATETHIPPARLADGLLDLMAEIFSPVAKLNLAQRDVVTGTLQAAALVVEPDSPVLVAVGDPLAPVIRHNDRLGRSQPSDVLPLPWTVLETLSRQQHQLSCQIHSAHLNPLGRKSRLRLVRYAQATRDRSQTVHLKLHTADGEPLIDYEIIERERESGSTVTLGRTNEMGVAMLPAASEPWQLLYVRHGERVLARLPIISGASDHYVAELPSDDVRLAAEGFVAAFRQEVIDTVARRQILAARIRRRIATGKFDEGQTLLNELRGIPSASEFTKRLNAAKVTLRADNARAQQLIDQMFAQTRQMLEQYLDPGEVNALSRQLETSRAEG